MSGPRRLSFTGPRFATADDLTRLRADLPGDPHGPGAFTLAIGRPAVGFAHAVAVAPGHWHLAHLHVERDARRRGLGRYLLDSALGTALDRGAVRLTVSPPSKAPWRALYARAGFAPEASGDGTLIPYFQVGPAGHDRHGAHFIQPLDLPCGARLGGLGSPR